jgi:hypothetical protein
LLRLLQALLQALLDTSAGAAAVGVMIVGLFLATGWTAATEANALGGPQRIVLRLDWELFATVATMHNFEHFPRTWATRPTVHDGHNFPKRLTHGRSPFKGWRLDVIVTAHDRIIPHLTKRQEGNSKI